MTAFVTSKGQAMMIRLLPLSIGLLLVLPVQAEEPLEREAADSVHVVMHKNPGCGCCDSWAENLRSHGFTVESVEDPGIMGFKAENNVPRPLMSCHTAIIDGYFVEGHVPASDILRLLKEKPQDVAGLTVPGMPLGSPGMEHPRPQDFNTIAILADGKAYVIFESHKAGEDFSAQ